MNESNAPDDVETDDDLLDDLDDDLTDEAPEAPQVEDAPKAKAKPKVAEAPKEDPSQSEFVTASLNALKSAWVSEAKAAGHVAADFDSIGLAGFDDHAKAAFLTTAASSHTKRVEELASQGFVFQPSDTMDTVDEKRKGEWGATGPGLAAAGSEKLNEQVADAVSKGSVKDVIQMLPDLGTFFVKGRR
jgi:hypothetical protein